LAEGRFIFSLQALGTLAVYLIATAAVSSLHPLSRAASLLVMAGALVLLLPLLLIPLGSGGLLSCKAEVDYEHLAHYEDEEEGEGVGEAGGAAARQAGGSSSAKLPDLHQPLLQPEQGADMQRCTARQASAALGAPALESANSRSAPEPLPPAAAALPPELSPWQCLRSSTFWLLFAVLVIGLGSGALPGRAEVGSVGCRPRCEGRPACGTPTPTPPLPSTHRPPRPHPAQQPGPGRQGAAGGGRGGHPRARLALQRWQLRG
jgi:hypothetical protein